MRTESTVEPGQTSLPSTYDRFVKQLRQASQSVVISPRVFQKAMAFSQGDIAALAHVHRVTVSRSPENPQIQGFMREALRVLSNAAQIHDDFREVAFWFRNEPLSAFGHKTPAELVSEGRTDDVIAYVQSLDAGVSG
ncbi:DUF2384 domain-containing protein [Aquisalimonas lutea]|uniref:antitoxin Xre/MbcA/ParS toxin-binding domain-containing protein n=1 Tax=Aquisalimonas lutea TaxID=1327750 RepID=UPI0025B5E051|nr:antitoxin Xre/MbcA/ParS toxin-binding domain-containing protein [Aquisalimonas lutea]MDN3517271.1 DUF2384 domain-containing protein [Aquisalimonas lutea]